MSTFENRDASFDPGTLLARAGWLRGLAAGLVADRDEAEDLVQDTFLAAIERPPRAPRALGSWLNRVLRNFTRLRHREAVNRRRRETAAARPEREGLTPAEIVERAEIQERLFRLVLELAEPYRSTVLQRFFEDLTPAEIARREGIAATTVRSRLGVAIERLRDRLDSTHAGGRAAWRSALVGLIDPKSLSVQGSAGAAAASGGAAAAKVGSGALGWISMGGVLLTSKTVILTCVGAAAVLAAGIGIGRRTLEGVEDRARLAGIQEEHRRAVARIRSLEEEKAAADARWKALLAATRTNSSPAAKVSPGSSDPTAAPEGASDPAAGFDATLRKLLEGGKEAQEAGELSAEEIEKSLEKHGREPQFLIVAAQLSQDQEAARRYLEEALEKDPSYSPALLSLLDLQVKAGDGAEAIAATIERLRTADPENALASCYSAKMKFQAGDARGALDDLLAAVARPKISDYNQRHYETFQDFYRDAGRGEAASKVISACGLRMGYLPALRELSKSASAEAFRLLEAGEGQAGEAYVQATAQLASKLSASGYSLLHHAVGVIMEREALETEKSILTAAGASEKAAEIDRRLEESRLRLAKYRKIAGAYLPALTGAPESEVARFFDRIVREGEVSAALDLEAVREAVKEAGR